jgi:hypothetical protein
MAMGLTQPLREMGTRNISREVKGLKNLTPSCADYFEMG